MRYSFPVRLTLDGDQTLAASFVGEARVLLGALMHDLGEGNIRSGKRERTRENVKIEVSFDGTLGAIRIRTAVPGGTTETTFDLWVPEGIVVEPAGLTSNEGWGLPLAEAADPLDPSADPTDWTAGGPQPDVLLSKTLDAGYPPRAITALPMYYDSPEKKGKFELPTPGDEWAAYRASFYDIGDDARAVLDAVNATRTLAKPLVPPYRGFSQLAAWYQRMTGTYGFVDADMPPGSNTFYKRVQKDGTALEVDTASPVGSIGAVDTSGALSPQDVADALITALPALSSDVSLPLGTTFAIAGGGAVTYLAAIDQNDQWVKCGNIDWKSIHDEIPRLSWFGSRGRSIPSNELGCGVVGTTIYNGTLSPSASFTSYWLDESQSFFHDSIFKQFDRFVFARGRVLAMLPNNGYCLGAAVQKLEATNDRDLTYRLVAIAWHRDDQKAHEAGEPAVNISSPQAVCWDTTSDIRVWYADLPTRNGLACAPDRIVDDLYDVDENPTGWQAFSRHRLTLADTDDTRMYWFGQPPERNSDYATDHEYNAPKGYFQTWLFNGSGTEAVCLRSAAEVERPFGFLFNTKPFGPMQAIKCAVSETDSSISLAWHAPNGNVFDFGERWPIAWDYRGDDEAIAYFGSADGSAAGVLRIEATNGDALASWSLLAPGAMAFAFDARTDSALIGAYTFGARPGFPSEIVTTAIDVTAFHNASEFASQSIAVGTNAGTSIGYGGWGIIDGYAYGPLWRDAYGHGDVMPTLAVFGDDVFMSYWIGATPGARGGDPPYNARSDYAFVGSSIASSIPDIGAKLGVEATWSNFGGVV